MCACDSEIFQASLKLLWECLCWAAKRCLWVVGARVV